MSYCRVTDPDLGIDVVAEGMRQKTLNAVLCNSFAFGGSNAVLIARRFEE